MFRLTGARTSSAGLFSEWAIVAILTVLAVSLRLWDPGPVKQLRLMAFDTYQRLAPREFTPDLPVRIIDIDDASLKRIGQWPWSRSRLAELVNKLNDLGAAAIGFDFVFSEPDRTSPEQFLQSLPGHLDRKPVEDLIADLPANDNLFAQALERGNSVLGLVLNQSIASANIRSVPKAGFSHAGDDPRLFVPNYAGLTKNLEILEQNSSGLGILNWVPDGDQIARRLPLLARIDDQLYPTISTELLRIAQGAGSYLAKSSGASEEGAFGAQTGMIALRVGDFILPTAANGEMWLYYSGHRDERFIPAWKILDGSVDPNEILGRILLVGTSAPGLFDLRATPLDAAVPGVEVHAEGLEQMITGSQLFRPDFALALELLAIIVAGLLIAMLIGLVGPQWTAVVSLASLGVIIWASWRAFSDHGWLVDPIYPSLMAATVYVAATGVGYLRNKQERDQVRRAFGFYLAPSVVEDLAQNPDHLVLGGEERDLTILFSDIRNFTSISETMDPVRLTDFINRFLTPMTEVILNHSGTIDKYMGDAVMAFWNAPVDDEDHAANGCKSALLMRDKLAEMNRELAQESQDLPLPIRIGIGLNSGPCCVGNLGSTQRFAYSAIGDNVNVASRLEGQTKTYGVDILASQTTVDAAPDYAFLELDRLKVIGRDEPVAIFALLGDPSHRASAHFGELSASNNEMLAAYSTQNWEEALSLLKTCRKLAGDQLETHYGALDKRIKTLKRRPPGPGWDGSSSASGK